MFLRGLAVSRVPAAILRLYGTSARSISSSANFSRVSSPLLRCHRHAVTTSTPQLARHYGTTLIRFWKGQSHQSDGRDSSSDNKWLCAWAATAVASSLLAVKVVEEVSGRKIPSDAELVDCDTFTRKYLGKIEKIVFVDSIVVGKNKAVGKLRAGAIIDGKPATPDQIVIDYPESASEFKSDVRSLEAARGISHSQKVEIEESTTWLGKFCMHLFALSLVVHLGFCVADIAVKRPAALRNAAIRIGAHFMLLSWLATDCQLKNKEISAIENAIPAFAPQFSFGTFVRKYLRAGKIEKISFIVGTGEVVATLRSGDLAEPSAQQAECGHILVNYKPRWFIHNRETLRQFREEVRKEEAKMGIPPSQGVPIEEFDPLFGWRCLMNVPSTTLIVFAFLMSLSPLRAKAQAVRPPITTRILLRGLGRLAIFFSIIGILAAVPEYFRFSGPRNKFHEAEKNRPRTNQSCYLSG